MNIQIYPQKQTNNKTYSNHSITDKLARLHKECLFVCLSALFLAGFHRNIHKDKQELELLAQSDEDVESWKASLLRAGVYPVRTADEHDDSKVSPRREKV